MGLGGSVVGEAVSRNFEALLPNHPLDLTGRAATAPQTSRLLRPAPQVNWSLAGNVSLRKSNNAVGCPEPTAFTFLDSRLLC